MRGKVKQMLVKHFGDELLFVTVSTNEAQVVISKNVLTNTKKASFMKHNKHFVLNEAAKLIKDDIELLIQTAQELPWPPTVESLLSEHRQPPESLRMFLTTLLHSTDHSPGNEVIRYVDSFSQDILYAVSKRKFLTRKHVLLGNGLHSITGLKKAITVLARLGHSCNYNKIQEIQTAQAELAQEMSSLQHPLALIPVDSTSKVKTFFWWDNFDCNKETIEGSVHTCHGVAFQEESAESMERNQVFEVPESKKRTISVVPVDLPKRKVTPHKEPASFHGTSTYKYDDTDARRILLCWNLLRQAYSVTSQSISRFVGWISLIFGRINSKSTRITFLPPIIEYSTVLECIVQSQKLAKASNMTYAHITVDAGAAAKFYHILCISEMKPDLACFTETWLHDGISTDCINISGYNLIYKNRTSGIHGGVCTYIRNSIKFKTLNFLHHPDFEVLWVYVRPKRHPRGVPCTVIGTVYHSPSADDNSMIDHLSLSLTSIEGYYPGCGIFLTGDFNRLNVNRLLVQFKMKQLDETKF